MKELNALTRTFSESVIRMMTRICNQAGGINLAQGFPDWDTPEEIKEAAVRALRQGYNQYAITWGSPSLRRAIARKVQDYNRYPVDPETEITVCCGSTECMLSTMKAIINPGDEVVVFEPFYENYGPDALLSGATPRYVTLQPPDWRFDPQKLAAAFNQNTKAVILNSPNNPSGKVFSRAELEQIAELCRRWDAFCICDDIYEHILYDGAEHIAMASLEGMKERTITINSVSKTYSATGWRVGWAIAAPEVTDAIRKVHDFVTVGAAAPLQEAAAFALGLPGDYYRELQARYLEGRDYLYGVLEELGFNPSLPRGAYYIITEPVEIMERLGADDDFTLARRLIEVAGVATVPGSSFYADPAKGRRQVRFCFCKKPETLKRAAQGLRRLGRV